MATWWTLATSRRAGATTDVRVRGGRLRNAFGEPPTIQDLYGLIAVDAERKSQIVRDVAHAVASGRSPLVLSGRTDHVEWLGARLRAHAERVSLLKGGMGPKTANQGDSGTGRDGRLSPDHCRDGQLRRRRLRRLSPE
jgi:hypothetical protein